MLVNNNHHMCHLFRNKQLQKTTLMTKCKNKKKVSIKFYRMMQVEFKKLKDSITLEKKQELVLNFNIFYINI